MSEATTTPAQLLIEKVLGAAHESGYVQKDNRHGQGYNYADDEAITTKFRNAMLGQGVLVFPEDMEFVDVRIVSPPEDKTPTVLVSIRGFMTVTDGAASFKVASLGQGIDKGDKAIYKAMTGWKKYAYRHLVMMATGDDPEIPRDDEKPQAKAQSQPVQQSSAPAQQPNGAATQAQKNLIRAKAREAGLSDDELKALRLSATGKHSSKDFTKADVDSMLAAIESAAQAKSLTGGEVVG